MPDPAALAVAQIFRIDYHSFLRDHNLPAILFDLLDLSTVESAGRSLNLAIAARNAVMSGMNDSGRRNPG